MGMKDSDDYITARAANPRTGLISPSLAGTPRTPESPAEALRLRAQRLHTASTRADEARKVSAGNSQRFCSGEKCWSSEDAKPRVASPWPSDASAGAAEIVGCEAQLAGDTGEDDRFVVHMPSAREPQPYAFPGKSAQEIRAFEHYKGKARGTSGDGWDQRCVQSGGIRKSSATECERGRKRIPSNVMPGQFPTRDGTVVRRGHPGLDDLDGAAFAGADLHHVAASFAPYSSSKTPARRTSGGRRQKPTRILNEDGTTDPRRRQSSPPIAHLSQLPRVHLVRPELASLPMPRLRKAVAQGKRSCSLGCDRSAEAGTCPQLAGDRASMQALFASHDGPSSSPVGHATALLTHLRGLLCTVQGDYDARVLIRMLRPAVINTLTSPDASFEEKLAASKALLAVVGQVIGALMAMSIVWKLYDAVAGTVSLIVWPLVVPLKVIWWFVSG